MRRDTTFTYATLAVFSLFALLVIVLGVNIPQQDDFDSIFFYLLGSRDDITSGLFTVHVSHRLVATRLLALAGVLLGGEIELRLLMLIAMAILFGTIYLFYRSFRDSADKPFLLLIISLCLLSLFHWSSMLWATAAIQNYFGLFIAVSSLYLFVRNTTAGTAGAIVIASLAPYVSSNGLLVLPLLFVWCVCSRPAAARHARLCTALLLFVLSSGSVLIYLFGFDDAISLNGAMIADSNPMLGLFVVIKAYLTACAGFLHFAPLALLAGAAMNLYFIALIARRYDKKNPAIFYSIAYLLVSMALVALFRHGQGIEHLIASRYQVFTLGLTALMLVSFFEQGWHQFVPVPRCKDLILLLCTLLYLASWFYYGNLLAERERIVSGLTNWRSSGETGGLYHPRPATAGQILDRAIDSGLYNPPAMQAFP